MDEQGGWAVLGVPPVAPVHERHQGRGEIGPLGGQSVLVADRTVLIRHPVDDPEIGQPLESVGQEVAGNAQVTVQGLEPAHTPEEVPQDEQGPPITDRFEGRGDAVFPLLVKEVATKADDQTQTFRVTLSMNSPDNFRVLPGMTATVRVDFSAVMDDDTAKWVPINAVQADSELDARIWVLDDSTMTVSSRPVKIGRMSGRRIEVLDGLRGGEEIVAVGAPYLAEGMLVTRMRQREQAVSREDETS